LNIWDISDKDIEIQQSSPKQSKGQKTKQLSNITNVVIENMGDLISGTLNEIIELALDTCWLPESKVFMKTLLKEIG